MICDKKFLFVLNPIAGGKKKADIPARILDFCKDISCSYKIYETTGKNDEESIRTVISGFYPDAIIAIGGDGTINLVGNILVGTEIPLGIIPLGSSNGLARDLGLPLDIDEAFEVIQKFAPKAVDTLKINGRNCFHLSDFGFNARICHRFAESILRGRLSYLWYGLQEFFTFKSFDYQIETHIQHYEGKAFMMIITNANKLGTNLTVNPLGEIDDGWFEISILKPFPRIAAPYIFYHLVNDSIYRTPFYKIIRCKAATVHNKVKEFLHIDGEPIEMGDKIEVLINPKSLRILLS